MDPTTEKLVREEIEPGKFRNLNDLIGVALKHFLMAREPGEEYTQQEIHSPHGAVKLSSTNSLSKTRLLAGFIDRTAVPRPICTVAWDG
ncbi:MAG: hypothetical protein ACRD3T_11015 [Terriglobia bacterium]